MADAPLTAHPDALALSCYADGELRPDQVARLEAHLADCPACRAEVAANQRLTVAVRRLTAAPVPAGFSGDVAARVAGVPQQPAPARRRVATWLAGWSPRQRAVGLAGVSAAAVLVVLTVSALERRERTLTALVAPGPTVVPRTGPAGGAPAGGAPGGAVATTATPALGPRTTDGTGRPADGSATTAVNGVPSGATPDEAVGATDAPPGTPVLVGASGTPGGAESPATGSKRVAGSGKPAPGAGMLTVAGRGEVEAGVARVWLPVVERGG